MKINHVKPTNSPYASPIVLVNKEDGSLHPLLSVEALIRIQELPQLDELVDAIGNQRDYISTTLDLTSY